MHEIQRKLLDLCSNCEQLPLSLREIGRRVEVNHPQKIKHHLNQLVKKNLIIIDEQKKIIKLGKSGIIKNTKMFSIPILGLADCGQATAFADEYIEGYLKVSASVIKKKKNLFCVKAKGNSMNNANINGKSIENGDFVIIDGDQRNPKSGDYVLSVIDGCANIKRFVKDIVNNCYVLLSESTENYPPIFNDEKDFTTTVKLRYRTKAIECNVKIEDDKAYVTLNEGVFGVATGQAAVFYDENKLIGGGWIKEV